MSAYERHPQGGTIRLGLCILAIVIGVLMCVDHKAAGVIEVTLGLLLL